MTFGRTFSRAGNKAIAAMRAAALSAGCRRIVRPSTGQPTVLAAANGVHIRADGFGRHENCKRQKSSLDSSSPMDPTVANSVQLEWQASDGLARATGIRASMNFASKPV
jgi:hypothetical protein